MEKLEKGLGLENISDDNECDNCGAIPAGANPYITDEYFCAGCYDWHEEYAEYSKWYDEFVRQKGNRYGNDEM